jgi:hypothetical protein
VHSTRIATFLLGAWIACCILLDLVSLQTMRLAGQMLNSAIPPAAKILQDAGREPMRQLLHHFAAEQYRYYFTVWGLTQIVGGVLLAALLYFATEKRVLPLVLCAAMVAFVLFQLAIHPELAFRGQEADFPPGSQSLGTQARVLLLVEIWIGVEMAKLLVGGVLAGYIFTYKSRRRSRRGGDPIPLERRLNSVL